MLFRLKKHLGSQTNWSLALASPTTLRSIRLACVKAGEGQQQRALQKEADHEAPEAADAVHDQNGEHHTSQVTEVEEHPQDTLPKWHLTGGLSKKLRYGSRCSCLWREKNGQMRENPAEQKTPSRFAARMEVAVVGNATVKENRFLGTCCGVNDHPHQPSKHIY